MSPEEKKIKTGYLSLIGWIEIANATTPHNAEKQAGEKIAQERKISKEKADKARREDEERIFKAWENLQKLEVIPTTIQNLQVVMQMLNYQNWGGWKLPKMSIGYKASQYDCDGKTATTFTLDAPLNGKSKFQIGAPFGHLTKYTAINRF